MYGKRKKMMGGGLYGSRKKMAYGGPHKKKDRVSMAMGGAMEVQKPN